MFIIEYLGNLKLGWLIKFEYICMAFFIVGAITSQWGKPLKVKSKNFSTICLVLTVFFFRGVINAQAQTQGPDGKLLTDVLNNDFARSVFYAFLVWALLRRLIRTCRAERVRKQRWLDLLSKRTGQSYDT